MYIKNIIKCMLNNLFRSIQYITKSNITLTINFIKQIHIILTIVACVNFSE